MLVLDRDRGCRFPGCPVTAADYLEVHHRVHWRDGGLTDLDNLLCLCTFHHDSHHRGEYTITGDPTRPDGLRFQTRQGWPIGPAADSLRRPPEPPTLATVDPELPPADLLPAGKAAAEPSEPPRGGRSHPRPTPRLGRTYPAPTGGTLHLHLVDLTPSRAAPRRE